MKGSLAHTDVIVLAGGRGSRIREVLGDTPKLLAPIAERPFIEHLLDRLARQRARRVVFSLGYLADKVTAYLDRISCPLPTDTAIEPRPLGTAGAIAFARAKVASDPVLVINGDTWLNIDMAAMLETHRGDSKRLGTIAVVKVPDAGRYGRVEIASDGLILSFAEKESGSAREGFINAGVYLFSARLLDDLARGGARSLEYDVLPSLPRGSLKAFIADSRSFIDIGTPESYAAAPAVILANAGARDVSEQP